MYQPWTPEKHQLLLPKDFSFQKFSQSVKKDIILADQLFLPKSYKLTGVQRVTLKALKEHKVIFMQAGRGSAKTYTVARFILLEALTNKIKVVCTGPTYRQALLPFNYVKELVQENSVESLPFSLARELDGSIVTGNNIESRIKFKNGSIIKALPMGNGQRLRGERAHILVCDEFFAMDRTLFNNHIVPFLLRPMSPNEYESKLIMSTSAEYEDSFAYYFLTNEMLPQMAKGNKKYMVLDWQVEDIKASGMILEPDIMALLVSNQTSEEKERVLHNKWVGTGGQFFPANLRERMASPKVHVEYEAEPGFAYSLSVDVATSNIGDNFVIQVWKFLGNKEMALVNSFWDKGLSPDEMALKIHEYNDKFRPEWIVMDKGGGGLFVQSSLSKRRLVLRDNSIVEIPSPILLHDEYGALIGQKKLILTQPTDPLVRSAFSGDRARGGEHIHSEDIFVHLLYDGLRNTIMQDKCPILIPLESREDFGDQERSEERIKDLIWESVYQLRHLSIKYQENPDGSKDIVRSKINKVPMYVWKNSSKDGASAFAYGYIAYCLHYAAERGADDSGYQPIVQEVRYDGLGQLKQMASVEREPGQFFNPFTGQWS